MPCMMVVQRQRPPKMAVVAKFADEQWPSSTKFFFSFLSSFFWAKRGLKLETRGQRTRVLVRIYW